ncbi:hypothetical protein ON010_g3259 [Phytophthora cinnamomi]|nr:hypothetical protein ON010_g3259 [Phytophthora cinnamomi]
MFTTTAAGNCIDNDKMYYGVNAPISFATRVIYEDKLCSGSPSLITFSPVFACQQLTNYANTTCHSVGNSLFEESSCTTNYADFATNAFGSAPFMIDRYYPISGCNNVGYVNVFSADCFCHINPEETSSFSSFRARIAADGSLIFSFFHDSACKDAYQTGGLGNDMLTSAYCMPETCAVMNVMCSRQNCGFPPYGQCSRMFSVGGRRGTAPMGEFSSITVYANNSCSSPAVSVMLTNSAICTSQNNHFDLSCTTDGNAYYSSDCTQYYTGGGDDIGIISDAFGSSPYLVEKCVWCGMMDTVTDVMVYRLDENCYSNAAGDASHKLTLGRSLTITTYAGANCMNVASEILVDRSTILSNGCGADDKKYFLANAKPSLSVIAVYEDGVCSDTPSQLTFTPTIGYHDSQALVNAQCESIGNSLFSVSSCTSDYLAFATTAFGVDNPFVLEEAFSVDYCNGVGLVTMYVADNTCHTNSQGFSSFRAKIGTDGALVFRTFYDLECNDKQTTITLAKGQLTTPICTTEYCNTMTSLLCSLENCYWWGACGRRLSLGGLDSGSNVAISAVLVYDSTPCTNNPVRIIAKKQLTCTPVSPMCTDIPTGSSTMYQDRACIEDVAEFAKSRCTDSPYLIVEKYKDGTNCGKQKDTIIYKAGDMCYYSFADGRSFRILPYYGDSVIFTKYPTTSCNDSDAVIIAIGSNRTDFSTANPDNSDNSNADNHIANHDNANHGVADHRTTFDRYRSEDPRGDHVPGVALGSNTASDLRRPLVDTTT